MVMKKRGTLLVVSGPSGAGKGTLIQAVLKKRPEAMVSVSATTRAPRPGEKEGIHYFFVSKEKFEKMIQEHAFLEYACVFGTTYYGTPRAFVEQKLAEGNDVILDIDVQGAMNIKQAMPEAVLVFILPPSYQILRQRLTDRKTESDEQIERRLQTAKNEIKYINHYQYLLINDTVTVPVITWIIYYRQAICMQRVKEKTRFWRIGRNRNDH